ncbi:MAG: hypothetical protein WBP93_08820 [Pyrinomonadaceae bacterium]
MAMRGIAAEFREEEVREKMKAVTAKQLWSISGVVVAASFLSVVLIVCAHIAVLAQGAQDDLFLVTLAFGGAVASAVNGFGRRAVNGTSAPQSLCEEQQGAGRSNSSAIHIGC